MIATGQRHATYHLACRALVWSLAFVVCAAPVASAQIVPIAPATAAEAVPALPALAPQTAGGPAPVAPLPPLIARPATVPAAAAVPPPAAFPPPGDGAPPAPAGMRGARLVTTTYGKKMVAVPDATGIQRYTPLLWAEGITQVGQLDDYASLGLNTVVVRLAWRLQPDGSLLMTDVEGPRAFAEEAARRGLGVIYALPPAPTGMELAFRTSSDSGAYMAVWSAWVGSAIDALHTTPGLIGWMLPDDPRALDFCDDNGFARWIKSNYASVDILNRQWRSGFNSLDDVTLISVRNLIDMWRGPEPMAGDLSQEELNQRFDRMNRKIKEDNFAFHPASLALAHYQWEAYRALQHLWARQVREADPGRLVLSGRLNDYAQLLSLPASIDIAVTDLRPGAVEMDVATHNPQAIDIARRGGRFAAIAGLSTSAPQGVSQEGLASLIPMWADTALAHGASGMFFSSWAEVARSAPLQHSIKDTLTRLRQQPCEQMWQLAPVSTAALVLTPLADGHTMHWGPTNVPGAVRGLYGFGDNLIGNEPSDLVYALRWGSCFGSIDYLSPDDIGADGNALARYSTVLLPQALSVNDAMAQGLSRYTASGGIVVGDLGMAAAQTAGQLFATAQGQPLGLPPMLASLFGVAPGIELRTLSFNLQPVNTHPLLPTWERLVRTQPVSVLTAGDAPGGAAFAGPVLYGTTPRDVLPIGQAPQLPKNVLRTEKASLTRVLSASLTLHPFGNGFAMFAPFRLWSYWRPGQMGFDAFHGDLFSRAATVAALGAPSFVPAPQAEPNDARMVYPEIVNYPGSIALLNHNPLRLGEEGAVAGAVASLKQGALHALLQTAGTGNFLWSNSVCAFPAFEAPTSLVGGRPAPIANPNEFEKANHIVELHARCKPMEMTVLELLPIRAQNVNGGPLVTHVSEYNDKLIRLMAWPNTLRVMSQPTDINVAVGDAGTVRVTVYSGKDGRGYTIVPGARHRISYVDLLTPRDSFGKRPPTVNEVTANERGQIIFDMKGAALTIEITPLENK